MGKIGDMKGLTNVYFLFDNWCRSDGLGIYTCYLGFQREDTELSKKEELRIRVFP